MEPMQIIELVAATIGLLYLWLEMRASMWLWPVGIVLPLFYIYISLESQVYGNVLVNVYYIIACILGWIAWRRRRGDAPATPHITHTPPRPLAIVGVITLLLVVGLYLIYQVAIESPFPIWDAIATSVSLVGMWLLAKEYIETWICWILSNVIYCVLYFEQGFTITGWYFVLYSIISVWGGIRWYRLMKADKNNYEKA